MLIEIIFIKINDDQTAVGNYLKPTASPDQMIID